MYYAFFLILYQFLKYVLAVEAGSRKPHFVAAIRRRSLTQELRSRWMRPGARPAEALGASLGGYPLQGFHRVQAGLWPPDPVLHCF